MSCQGCPRALNGWFRGCLTATAALDGVILAGALWSSLSLTQSLSAIASMVLWGVPITLVLTCLFTGLPAAFLIWFAELLRIRSKLFYVCGGAAIGALSGALIFRAVPQLSVLFVVAGSIAGIAYWSVAGRYAGEQGGRPER